MGLKNVKFAHTYDYSNRRRNGFHLLILITIELLVNLSNCSETITLNDQQTTLVHALAIVPTTHKESDFNLLPTWMKGEEILPAIQLAVKEINEQYNFLRGHQLEVIPVRVPMCDLNEGNLQFVKSVERNTHILGSVGYICQNLDQHFVHLLKHKEISAIQIAAHKPPVTTAEYSRSGSHLQYSILPSLQSTARAAVRLMQTLDWKRVAVVSNRNFIIQQLEFVKEAEMYSIEVALILQSGCDSTLKQLQTFGIKIIVLFLSPTETVDILCCAYLHGFNWPHYAWILMETNSLNELSNISKMCSENCNTSVINAMNKTVLIRQNIFAPKKNYILPSGMNYSNYYNTYLDELEEAATELNATLQSNLYANVLYDSIWAFALSLNRSLNILKERNLSLINISHAKSEILDILEEQLSELSFHGATGFLNFSRSNVAALQTTTELFQFHYSHYVTIGSYDFTLDILQLNLTTLSDVPTDQLNHIYVSYPTSLAAILFILILLCFILTTLLTLLYVHYRKQPSIKATSTSLSACLFIGCYFLLATSFITTFTNTYHNEKLFRESFAYQVFACTCGLYLLNIGADLIFATIIAKTLRLYHIFNKFGKASQLCSDRCLFVFILITVSVKVVLLVLWTSLDVNYIAFDEQVISQSVPPYILKISRCQSNYLELWIGIVFGYSLLLNLIMIALAVLTRKIERKHFNESTIICKLSFLLFMIWIITVSLWFVFLYSDSINLRRLCFDVAGILSVISCHSVLILPKIYPLVRHSCSS